MDNNNKIRKFRDEFSLSRSQLAEMLDVSCRTVESWEIDRYSPSKPILKLLQYIRKSFYKN